jgi:hypothetical protein
VYNSIRRNRDLHSAQTLGTTGCVPKRQAPPTALTLFNTDYKIYGRVLVRRLSLILGDIIHSRQHCYTLERTIMDAVAGIRRVVAYEEQTQSAISILSQDFRTAFVRFTWLFVSYSQWKWFWWYLCGKLVGLIQECYLQMWLKRVPIGAFSDRMFGTIRMPIKRDHVCYSTEHLGWNIGRPTANGHVIKGIRISLWGRHHDHSEVEAVRNALHTYQRTAGATLNLTKPNPYHWTDGTLSMGSIPRALLSISSENFGHRIPCDYRREDRCTWSSNVTRIRNLMRSARQFVKASLWGSQIMW